MGAIGQGRHNQDEAFCIELIGLLGGFWLGGILTGVFCLGGFWLGGILAGGILS